MDICKITGFLTVLFFATNINFEDIEVRFVKGTIHNNKDLETRRNSILRWLLWGH